MNASFRRIAVSLVASAIALAACSGGSHAPLVPGGTSNAPAARSASPGTLSAQDGERAHVHHVAFLALTIDSSGNGTFSLAQGDDRRAAFKPSTDLSVPIPAFTLTCATQRSHHGDEDGGDGWCPFRHGDDDEHETRNFYVRQISATDSRHGDDDDWGFNALVVAGPDSAVTSNSASFPAANAPLSLTGGTRYLFDLVATDGTLTTPTPPPTPAPTNPCPQLPLVQAITQPAKSITTATGDPTTIQSLAQSFTGNVHNISCAVNGKMYIAAKFFLSGATYQFDPSSGTSTQWSSVAGDTTVVGGDSHVYEQGAFGKNKAAQLAQFSLDGTTQTFVAGGVANLMLTGPDGNVYTVLNNGGTESVEVVKPDASVATFALPAACGANVDADASAAGALWFHSPSCGVVSMTPSGTFGKAAILSDSLGAMVPGPDGALFATDKTANAIVRIDTGSGGTVSWPLPSNLQPNGLTRGYGPTIWFDAFDTNTSTTKICVIDLLTGVITQFDQGGATLDSSYTIGPDGNIYTFAANGSNAILRINGSAKF